MEPTTTYYIVFASDLDPKRYPRRGPNALEPPRPAHCSRPSVAAGLAVHFGEPVRLIVRTEGQTTATFDLTTGVAKLAGMAGLEDSWPVLIERIRASRYAKRDRGVSQARAGR